MPSKTATKKTTTPRATTAARKPANSTTKATTKASTKATAKASTKSTAKATTSRAAKPRKAPPVSVVKDVQSAVGVAELKKPELIELVVERSDIKKKFAKPVIEAMIEVLGEALAKERPLNLQPMGRVLPQRVKDAGTNRVIITRIRQSKERVKEAAAAHSEKLAVAKVAK